MKNVLVAAVVVGLLALAPPIAHAGERYLGRILVSDGGTVSNATTGYGSAGCANIGQGQGGNCDKAFDVPTSAKLTFQCDEACVVSANTCGTDAGTGLTNAASEKFPTSTGAAVKCSLPDGGSYTGGVVSVSPAVGAASARMRVFERSGTE